MALNAMAAAAMALLASAAMRQAADPAPPPVSAADQILAASPAADWRQVDPENTLYLDLPGGRVIIELAPAFAPNHVANIKRLVRQGYFDGLAIVPRLDQQIRISLCAGSASEKSERQQSHGRDQQDARSV